MKLPGAQVVGHHAVVRPAGDGSQATCTCSYQSTPSSVAGACLALTRHLSAAVKSGARVVTDRDGLAGVREPRRPLQPHDSGSLALEA